MERFDAELVRQIVTMEDVAEHYGIRITRNRMALCPFHDDRHPSMMVYPEDRGFYCFVCNKGGDIFEFIKAYEGVSFGEAIRIAASIGGLTGSIEETERAKKLRAEREARRKRYKDYCNRYARLCERFRAVSNRIYEMEEAEREADDFSDEFCSLLSERERLNKTLDEMFEALGDYENGTGLLYEAVQ